MLNFRTYLIVENVESLI